MGRSGSRQKKVMFSSQYDVTLLRCGRSKSVDVSMQFIWKSNTQNKKDAINDMMNTALEAVVTTRPTVGYLIQVRFSRKKNLKGAIKVSQTQDIEETVYPSMSGSLTSPFEQHVAIAVTISGGSTPGSGSAASTCYYRHLPDLSSGVSHHGRSLSPVWSQD